MSPTVFSPEWLNQFSDPYALLGLSVVADDRRVLKRYRTIAKLLHPDSYAIANAAEKALANQILARLVNPAYQKLKLEKGRAEVVATLRFRARRIDQDEPVFPRSTIAHDLMRVPAQELDVFYEQAIAKLAEEQFQPIDQFEAVTQQVSELNLLYLHLKIGAPVIREKRTGIVSASQAKPPQFAPNQTETAKIAINYAMRHYVRAQEYAKKSNWVQVVAELRDAIRLEADRAEYHSLIAKAYLMQNLTGMARVHFRQALKFNPEDPLAVAYAARLNLTTEPPKNSTPPQNQGGLFQRFAKKR